MNAADLGVVAVVLVSAILAFVRGFTREALAIGGWIAAIVVTIYGFETVKPFAQSHIEPGWLAVTVAGAGLFLVTLLVATLLARAIAVRIQASVLGPVDRSLGFVFGLARGAVLLCLGYLLLVKVLPADDRPAWILEARTLPLIERGTVLLLALAPPSIREPAIEAIRAAANEAEKSMLYDTLSIPGGLPAGDGGDGDVGYKSNDRQELEHLLETTN
ncbi:MAG: CvpA family protein [Alphaproteobacteria bacterium]